jgi:hypothetical protein
MKLPQSSSEELISNRMVTITASKDDFIFEVKGLHKLWSLKSELRVKREHVVQIHTYKHKHSGLFRDALSWNLHTWHYQIRNLFSRIR